MNQFLKPSNATVKRKLGKNYLSRKGTNEKDTKQTENRKNNLKTPSN